LAYERWLEMQRERDREREEKKEIIWKDLVKHLLQGVALQAGLDVLQRLAVDDMIGLKKRRSDFNGMAFFQPLDEIDLAVHRICIKY
jgi:type III secretory pathway component EscV